MAISKGRPAMPFLKGVRYDYMGRPAEESACMDAFGAASIDYRAARHRRHRLCHGIQTRRSDNQQPTYLDASGSHRCQRDRFKNRIATRRRAEKPKRRQVPAVIFVGRRRRADEQRRSAPRGRRPEL